MKEICPKDICTGCQACRLVCPVKAITFDENERGNIYPIIDQKLCIDCGKCIRTCPSLNPVKHNPQPDKAYACWIKNKENRKQSTSGGLSYGLSKKFVESGGVFVGVKWSAEVNNPIHFLTDNIEDLHNFQGSKYSHSDVKDTYKEVKELLENGRRVLFSGTPCQIAGIKTFLKNDYENFYTIGLVCHGVPSRKLLRDRIETLETQSGQKIIDYRSRVKTPDQIHSSCQYKFENGEVKHCPVTKDCFFRCFVTNYGLRPNCFNCLYASSERVEDITVADFWGYSPRSLKYRSYLKGTSEILINSAKGRELFDSIKDRLVIDTRPLEIARTNNRNLVAPQLKPKQYENFWAEYLAGRTLDELSPIYFPPTKSKFNKIAKIKTFIKMILPNAILRK